MTEEIEEECKICRKMLTKKGNHDPVYYVYHCKHCGYYILLEEIYFFYNRRNFRQEHVKLESLLINYKDRHKDVDFDYSCFVIGPNELVEKFENSGIYNQLRNRGFSLINIEYSFLGAKNE